MNFDVAIIGAGVAGVFSATRLMENNKSIKTILFDLGRQPGKRRRQLEGWFGCFPTGDGKLYSNIDKIYDICGKRKTNYVNKWFFNISEEINNTKLIKNKLPTVKVQNLIKSNGYNLDVHDYYQWHPNSIHQFSKSISENLEQYKNLSFSFDNEVFSILKKDGAFLISTENGDYTAKKVILCIGRSGWRWTNNLYKNFGIIKNDDYSKYGITIELASQYVKDFNRSHCSLESEDTIIGPLSWSGSIIQEDHADFTTSAFRSNEDRWKTDKVFFSLIKKIYFEDEGCYQTDRVAKLAFLLSNDRVGREKIKNIYNNTSALSQLPEYDWLKEKIEEIKVIFPQIINRGYFHYPTILPMFADINIGANMETEVDGLFAAGESAGLMGILSAVLSGALAADGVLK